MARKKPARPAKKAPKATKKAAPRAAARKTVKKVQKAATKAGKKKAKKPVKAVVRKARKQVKKAAAARKKAKTTAKAAKTVTRTAKKAVRKAVVNVKAVKAGVTAAVKSLKKPNLDRPRKTVADIRGIPSSLGMAGLASAAHSGGEELRDNLRKNNSASPRLTGGDVDANWQNAEAQGDESPGGDNPTPDQDVVDEIGRALGVEYADDEELQGGAEIAERDTHRWELDPSSKDDFDDED
jgi:hypothetical protein